jgi:NAD(P)-dependent dehydrogenase (short-subunit alcohol dehydrogenase family)
MSDLDGKGAIVTGGALGIGRAAARKLAEEGGSVEELRGEDLELQGLRADVTSSGDMQRLVGFAAETYGGVDVLVNSAGVQLPE